MTREEALLQSHAIISSNGKRGSMIADALLKADSDARKECAETLKALTSENPMPEGGPAFNYCAGWNASIKMGVRQILATMEPQ